MQFGYFTLSDNRYPGNTRTPETFIKDIFAEALYAEQIGLNSAWIGEHHFNLLGVNASPLAILAQLAGATTRLRLAPAVTLLPACRRGMGDARSVVGRAGRFRRRARLRPQGV